MMTDTRTPRDLGHKPSPTRAERDTWRKPAFTSTFTDRNGDTWQDVVTCAQCSFTSTDLNLDMCPGDGAVLGETSRAVAS